MKIDRETGNLIIKAIGWLGDAIFGSRRSQVSEDIETPASDTPESEGIAVPLPQPRATAHIQGHAPHPSPQYLGERERWALAEADIARDAGKPAMESVDDALKSFDEHHKPEARPSHLQVVGPDGTPIKRT